MNTDAPTDATTFWEGRYRENDRIWSGNPNVALVDVVAALIRDHGVTPGRALDLGSGEGADSLWLAEGGWRVTGVDISRTALSRAAEHAAERGLGSDVVTWIEADLASWTPATSESYDLVSACFLHSPVEFPREEVLRRAATTVARGGVLLVVGHASFPAGSRAAHEDHAQPPTLAEVEASLALPAEEWTTLVSELRSREGRGPDGTTMTLDDAVLVLKRR